MPADDVANAPATLTAAAAGGQVLGPRGSRRSLLVQNPASSTQDVAVGLGGNPSAFPGSNGIVLAPGDSWEDTTGYSGPLYLRSATSDVECPYLEIG